MILFFMLMLVAGATLFAVDSSQQSDSMPVELTGHGKFGLIVVVVDRKSVV